MKQYIPQPMDTGDIELPAELQKLSEELARNVHEVWSANRRADGWSYGPVRNDEKNSIHAWFHTMSYPNGKKIMTDPLPWRL